MLLTLYSSRLAAKQLRAPPRCKIFDFLLSAQTDNHSLLLLLRKIDISNLLSAISDNWILLSSLISPGVYSSLLPAVLTS
jgi:hypothetical protein